MTRLGDLERAVMDVLWDRGAGAGATVREVADVLRDRELAYTTVMTVLDRLAGKGMVEREREGRAWRYRPAASREAHIARLMLDALDLAGSRDAALVRFARSMTGTEAEVLRAALAGEAGDIAAHAQEEPAEPGAPTSPAPGDRRPAVKREA
ncbi:BlaI/MecI/CopY family transcriptional regulator [Plantactinospora sp. WMMB334]|uniref:BlaI/MecI/CopY family transcriptional regulator n=1 Tax=Plantactinospora sp. WMMB334 TaxID=3404119 RepID=UPI003B9520C0